MKASFFLKPETCTAKKGLPESNYHHLSVFKTTNKNAEAFKTKSIFGQTWFAFCVFARQEKTTLVVFMFKLPWNMIQDVHFGNSSMSSEAKAESKFTPTC